MDASKRFSLSLPARINLLGNPGDAVEGDFAVLSMAIEIRAGLEVEPADGLILELLAQRPLPGQPPEIAFRQVFQPPRLPLQYDSRLDLLKAAFNRLYAYSAELRAKFTQAGVRLSAWTEIPRQAGLGGSSVQILLALAALRTVYELDPHLHNDYVLAELAQRAEARELNITCGYADRYVPLFGGLLYIDYRSKSDQKPLHQEPYATVEHLDRHIRSLPLLAVTTGLEHNSGDVHAPLRARYLDEFRLWEQTGGDPPPMLRWMRQIYQTGWQGKIALLAQDWAALGYQMNRNHQLVDEMMSASGFNDGAGWANNLMIKTALENGAWGAKLTGAGGGGSVFALVPPDQSPRLAQAWVAAARAAGLSEAAVYAPQLARTGLIVRSQTTQPIRRIA